MKVKEVWEMGYSGKGVVTSILDDGLERRHPDLADNYVRTVHMKYSITFMRVKGFCSNCIIEFFISESFSLICFVQNEIIKQKNSLKLSNSNQLFRNTVVIV